MQYNETTAFENEFIINKFGANQGLTNLEINCMMQDNKGYIWVGTSAGVSNFNGDFFVNYTSGEFNKSPTNPNKSISNNTNNIQIGKVTSITQDKQNSIWLATQNGVFVMKYGKFFKVNIEWQNKYSADNICSYIFCSKDSSLWIGTTLGAILLNKSDINTVKNNLLITLQPNKFWALEFTKGGTNVNYITEDTISHIIYFAAFNNIVQYSNYQFKKIFSLTNSIISSVFTDSNDIYFIGFNDVAYKLVDSFGLKIKKKITNDIASSFCKYNGDRGDEYLILHQTKLTSFKNNIFIDYLNLADINIEYGATLLVDRSGSIWLGTWEGLVKLRKRIIKLFTPQTTKNLTDVFSVVQSPSHDILFGANRGNVLRFKDGEFTPLYNHKKPFTKAEVFSIFYHPDQSIWYGSGYQGITIYKDEKFYNFYGSEAIPDNTCKGFFIDYDKRFFALTDCGIIEIFYNAKPKETKFKIHYLNNQRPLNYFKIFDYAVMKNQTILASEIGLLEFKNNKLCLLKTGLSEIDNAKPNCIKCISDTEFWLGTEDSGLMKIFYTDNRYWVSKHFNQLNGLLSNSIKSILLKQNGDLILAHNNGISSIAADTNSSQTKQIIVTLTTSHGYLEEGFQYAKMTEDISTGDIFIGTTSGVMIIENNKFKIYQNPATPVITGVELINNKLDIRDFAKDIDYNSGIPNVLYLPYNQNGIKFFIQSVEPTFPNGNRCRYRLMGYDSIWHYTTNISELNYSALPNGDFVFSVQAANSLGAWSNAQDEIQIKITPAFWQNAWFIGICTVFLMLLITLVIYGKFKKLKRERSIKNKLLELESKALSLQMNPHFIFNCMNTIDSYIITERPDEASEYLQNFSLLIRSILENSRKEYILVKEEIETLERYILLEQQRANYAFNYLFEIDPQILEQNFTIKPMLLQPFIENSIIHGLRHKTNGQGELKIVFDIDQSKLKIVIADNGIGIAESKKINTTRNLNKKSLALKINAERMKLMKNKESEEGSFTIQELREGTMVVVYLPIISPKSN